MSEGIQSEAEYANLAWPASCQFDEIPSELPGLSPVVSGASHFRRALEREQAEITGSRDTYLTLAQEQALAQKIYDGVAADELLEKNPNLTSDEMMTLVSCAHEGRAARQELFLVNTRFAAWAARASMNIGTRPKNGKRSKDQKTDRSETTDDSMDGAPASGSRRFIGSYSDIRTLARPTAELEDRVQVAMEAMWNATGKFKPLAAGSRKPSSFSTFALYYIQGALSIHAQQKEDGGLHIALSTLTNLQKASREVEETENSKGGPVNRAELLSIAKRTSRGLIQDDGIKIGARDPRALLTGRYTTSLDSMYDQPPEERHEYIGSTALTLADIAPAPEVTFDTTLSHQLAKTIGRVLDTLSEREAGVIELRFGLRDGRQWTSDEVGQEYGVTRERIRQIESKTLKRLLHPSRSMLLKPFLDDAGEEAWYIRRELPATNDATINVRTIDHMGDASYNPDMHHDPTWQADASDTWDTPLRLTDIEIEEIIEKQYRVFAGELDAQVAVHWRAFTSEMPEKEVDNLASVLLEELDTIYAPQIIERAWNDHFAVLHNKLQNITSRNESPSSPSLDRIVALFNAMVCEVSASYSMTLSIPEGYSGRLNGLGAGLEGGMIIIEGDAGERLGERAGMNSYIVVNGNAGDLVGYMARANAQIYVRGDVGDYCGAQLKGAKVLITVEGHAGEAVGYDSAQGEIVVEQGFASEAARGARLSS